MSTEEAQDPHARMHAASAQGAVDAALAELRSRGERVTSARRAVLRALADRPDHLTADEVAEAPETVGVHRATVYRTLDLLAETGVVLHRHEPGAATRYHLAAAAEGHEHLHGHCRSCGAVVPLPSAALDGVARAVRSATGFRLDAAQSTLTGVCGDCAEPAIRA